MYPCLSYGMKLKTKDEWNAVDLEEASNTSERHTELSFSRGISCRFFPVYR